MIQNRVAAFLTTRIRDRAALVLAPAGWFVILLPWARRLSGAESFDLLQTTDAPPDGSWRPANTGTPLWVWWSSEVS